MATSARTSKLTGASLHVKLGFAHSGPSSPSQSAEANIAEVKVDLPKQLPSRLTTLRRACIAAQFSANPAGCPSGSVVGSATAVTPLLKSPLSGPAYLVSHGGAAFPDLVLLLQGEGVTIELRGGTLIRHGITRSTFDTVPDAPITSFELTLPQGPGSVLAANLPASANGSFCAQKLVMPTEFVAQNGAVIHQNTAVAVTGCAKAKKPKHRAKHHRRANRRKKP